MYRILIVDDDPMMLEVLQHILKSEGFEVLTCTHGRAALQSAPLDKPDMILLDVNLPEIEGHEVCRILKSDPKTKHIPIVMLTGEAREIGSRVQGLEEGAEDYLFKPIGRSVLVSRIKAILKIVTKPTK